ncbi:MAG: permease [Candidatus Zixiibacteriota bacterium]
MTDWKHEWKPLAAIAAVFLLVYHLPNESARFNGAVTEALELTRWYAREHVLLCLIPAFFIAGAIAVFVSKASVMKYLGAGANKVLAYGVASVSGTVLAVCSCTVLPLFAGVYRMGAGLGPASAFLYSGPAINVLAIILTARILGLELGAARAVGAVVFAILIGLLMHVIFRKDDTERVNAQMALPEEKPGRPLWQTGVYFGLMIAILVFANWAEPEAGAGFWTWVYSFKWWITSVAAALLGLVLVLWFGFRVWRVVAVGLAAALTAAIFPETRLTPFSVAVVGLSVISARNKGEGGEWFDQTWGFAKQILPLLLAGVLLSGLFLGRPGHEGLIPSEWIAASVGGNSLASNLFASVVGAFMYFATLTEVPILQGLIGSGMGKGPALALLLAGPALSLPNMLVLRSIMGTRKTIVYIVLVVAMATFTGVVYGALF